MTAIQAPVNGRGSEGSIRFVGGLADAPGRGAYLSFEASNRRFRGDDLWLDEQWEGTARLED